MLNVSKNNIRNTRIKLMFEGLLSAYILRMVVTDYQTKGLSDYSTIGSMTVFLIIISSFSITWRRLSSFK